MFWIVTQGVRPTFSLVRTWNRLAEGQTFGTAGVLSALSDLSRISLHHMIFPCGQVSKPYMQSEELFNLSYSTFYFRHSQQKRSSAFFESGVCSFFGAISLVTRSIGWAPTYLYHQCSNTLQRYKILKTLPSLCACAMETCHISLALPFLLREKKNYLNL